MPGACNTTTCCDRYLATCPLAHNFPAFHCSCITHIRLPVQASPAATQLRVSKALAGTPLRSRVAGQRIGRKQRTQDALRVSAKVQCDT